MRRSSARPIDPLPRAQAAAVALVWAASVALPSALALPVLGGGAVLVGVALRAWSMAHLGELFLDNVERAPGHPHVQSGPYRWLRHPSEVGLLCLCAGVALMRGSWLGGLAVVLLLLPVSLLRMRGEDALFSA